MPIKLDGRKLSLEIQERLKNDICMGTKEGERPPSLAVIRVGDDPASEVYVKNKEKACERVGIKSLIFHLDHDVSDSDIEELLNKLNLNDEVDGILLQLPLPSQLDAQKLISKISPVKDVDGLHENNAGKLLKNSLFLRENQFLRGHEFHYWQIQKDSFITEKDLKSTSEFRASWDIKSWGTNYIEEGLENKYIHASWMHLHFPSNTEAMKNLLKMTQSLL